MPSLLPEFEYDIFISYRHNDNLDGWVTEFVQNLEKELKGTVKEPVSIYFDKNPHDGLLDTHLVDKSLEGKLKCLIFIPIISQTYCDPKSFAWQHEFVAFNKLAKDDPFGRDIKLSNGNVASRILPIKIHDLDTEDKTQLENELGGALRPVEFIYKTPGVNRPLAPPDNPDKNQNQTFYRDQINKVANAVKEIITSLKNPVNQSTQTASTQNPAPSTQASSNRKKITITLLLLAIIAISSYFLYTQSTTNDQPPTTTLDKSIAVLPFADMSPNHDQEYFGDGVAEEIINVLAQTEDLKVIARSSSFQFKGKNEDLKKVGEMLGVATILEGSIRKSADQIRVTAQLIKISDGTHLWSKTFDRSPKDVFAVQDEIAHAVAAALKTTILAGATSTTESGWNEEAKKEYQLGRHYFDRHGKDDYDLAMMHFKKSIQLDSSKAIVYPLLSMTCSSVSGRASERANECFQYLDIALKLDPHQPEALIYSSFRDLYLYDFLKANEEMNNALKYGGKNPLVLRSAGVVLTSFGQYDKAIRLCEEAVDLDPLLTYSYLNLSHYYARVERFEEAIASLKKAREISQDKNDNLVELYILNNQLQDAQQENKSFTGDQRDFNEILIQKKLGNAEKAASLLSAYLEREGETNTYKCARAAAYAGKHNLALESLEKCFRKRDYLLVSIKGDPLLISLHKDPRFIDIVKRMNFPEN